MAGERRAGEDHLVEVGRGEVHLEARGIEGARQRRQAHDLRQRDGLGDEEHAAHGGSAAAGEGLSGELFPLGGVEPDGGEVGAALDRQRQRARAGAVAVVGEEGRRQRLVSRKVRGAGQGEQKVAASPCGSIRQRSTRAPSSRGSRARAPPRRDRSRGAAGRGGAASPRCREMTPRACSFPWVSASPPRFAASQSSEADRRASLRAVRARRQSPAGSGGGLRRRWARPCRRDRRALLRRRLSAHRHPRPRRARASRR